LALLGLLAGCSSLAHFSGSSAPAGAIADNPGDLTAEPAPAPEPPAPPATPPAAPPAATVATAAPIARPAEPARILVLRSSDADNYLSVSDALIPQLDQRFESLAVNLADAGIDAEAITAIEWTAAVAIGVDAADFAAARLNVPIVFCQIFDYGPLLERHPNLIGVEPLPPLELQLGSWRAIAPDALSVGLIVPEGETELVAAAQAAATAFNVELHTAYALTDRDATYQFKRFAQSVDALWLQPDSTILSPTAIRDILDYALVHQVQTIVFSPTLLDWGALLSVGSDTDDVAQIVALALDTLAFGDSDKLARVLPLTRVDAELNPEVASRLGVSIRPRAQGGRLLVTTRDDDT
jgi:putative ABC transport system substrate-binding protein